MIVSFGLILRNGKAPIEFDRLTSRNCMDFKCTKDYFMQITEVKIS